MGRGEDELMADLEAQEVPARGATPDRAQLAFDPADLGHGWLIETTGPTRAGYRHRATMELPFHPSAPIERLTGMLELLQSDVQLFEELVGGVATPLHTRLCHHFLARSRMWQGTREMMLQHACMAAHEVLLRWDARVARFTDEGTFVLERDLAPDELKRAEALAASRRPSADGGLTSAISAVASHLHSSAEE